MLPDTVTVGLLHLAPKDGDFDGNEALLVRATEQAAALGAKWVVSGELVRSGYAHGDALASIPTAAAFIERYAKRCAELNVTAFVHAPEVDGAETHSTMFVIEAGYIVGSHRKICVIPESEAWATPGDTADVIRLGDVTVGLLVCSDAHPTGIAARMHELGAHVLISSAAWHPGEWGPAGEWEARSAELGVPVIVANRTGGEFAGSVSVVAIDGEKVIAACADVSTIFVVELTDRGATLVRSADVSE